MIESNEIDNAMRRLCDRSLQEIREHILHGELDLSVDMSEEYGGDLCAFGVEVFGVHRTHDTYIQVYALVGDVLLPPSFSWKYEGTAESELQEIIGRTVADILEIESPGIRNVIDQVELFKKDEEDEMEEEPEPLDRGATANEDTPSSGNDLTAKEYAAFLRDVSSKLKSKMKEKEAEEENERKGEYLNYIA